jgi:hypothetical protein
MIHLRSLYLDLILLRRHYPQLLIYLLPTVEIRPELLCLVLLVQTFKILVLPLHEVIVHLLLLDLPLLLP